MVTASAEPHGSGVTPGAAVRRALRARTEIGLLDVRPEGPFAEGCSRDLPMPTIVVIGQDRVVRFADVHPDWLVRTEAQAVIDAVRPLVALAAEGADLAHMTVR